MTDENSRFADRLGPLDEPDFFVAIDGSHSSLSAGGLRCFAVERGWLRLYRDWSGLEFEIDDEHGIENNVCLCLHSIVFRVQEIGITCHGVTECHDKGMGVTLI